MNEHGLSPAIMMQQHIGPVIFREECVFKKEIKFGDEVKSNLRLEKATADFSRWTMVHEIWKGGDILSAVIILDGAWMDTVKRKLAVPPESFKEIFRVISSNTSM